VKKLNQKRALELLGRQIRKLRENEKTSQRQLAFEAGIGERQMGRIERGEINTTFFVLYKICAALNTTVSDLMKFLNE
jgi:transcriptional regulator with XRE-family HTH domain